MVSMCTAHNQRNARSSNLNDSDIVLNRDDGWLNEVAIALELLSASQNLNKYKRLVIHTDTADRIFCPHTLPPCCLMVSMPSR